MSPRQDQPQFESWGRYPKYPAELHPLFWKEDFPAAKAPESKMLAVGMGRSYGDVCLLHHGTLLQTPNLDRLISFDSQTGRLRCGSSNAICPANLAARSMTPSPPSAHLFSTGRGRLGTR